MLHIFVGDGECIQSETSGYVLGTFPAIRRASTTSWHRLGSSGVLVGARSDVGRDVRGGSERGIVDRLAFVLGETIGHSLVTE
jgi:hypothetical protein